MCYLKLLKLETFQPIIEVGYLKLSDKTWNEMCYLKLLKLETVQPIIGVGYLKLSDKTWNEMCYLKLLKLFNLFKPIMRATYLKLLIWNFWKLKLFKPIMGGGCLFETFRWDLKWDLLFETFETWNFSTHHRSWLFEIFENWNFSNPSWGGGAYLKLSDETWNEICYLKLLKLLKLFKLFNLKWDLLFETFETWNFSTHHRSWLFETFR